MVVDDLITGDVRRLGGLSVSQLDLADPSSIEPVAQLMRDNAVSSVIHFAGRKQVAESVARPAWYFQQNVGSLANVVMAMEIAGVKELVFSSSAAV